MTQRWVTPHLHHILRARPLKNKNTVGDSGYAAATAKDLGFEETDGAVGSGIAVGSGAPKPKRTRKPKQVGGAVLGLANVDTEPRGDPLPEAPLVKEAIS